jgi:hypothetical protein
VIKVIGWGLFALLFLALLAALVPVSFCKVGPEVREGIAEHLIDQLAQAAKSYELDHGEYPPGDGAGSRELVQCLERKSPKGAPIFDFSADMKDGGHVANPVWYQGEPPRHILHYRNNRTSRPGPGQPPVMNKESFDLWTEDSKGNPWGVNNWE